MSLVSSCLVCFPQCRPHSSASASLQMQMNIFINILRPYGTSQQCGPIVYSMLHPYGAALRYTLMDWPYATLLRYGPPVPQHGSTSKYSFSWCCLSCSQIPPSIKDSCISIGQVASDRFDTLCVCSGSHTFTEFGSPLSIQVGWVLLQTSEIKHVCFFACLQLRSK